MWRDAATDNTTTMRGDGQEDQDDIQQQPRPPALVRTMRFSGFKLQIDIADVRPLNGSDRRTEMRLPLCSAE
jgi:hypothetical protein